MKTLRVTTRTRALVLQTANNSVPGNLPLEIMKYDGGKYAKRRAVGEEIEVNESAVAIWFEARRDFHGPYFRAMCLTHP